MTLQLGLNGARGPLIGSVSVVTRHRTQGEEVPCSRLRQGPLSATDEAANLGRSTEQLVDAGCVYMHYGLH